MDRSVKDGKNKSTTVRQLLPQRDRCGIEVSRLCSREGNGSPLQYSCLEGPMDGEAWWAAVHGVAEGRTRLSASTLAFHFRALEKEMAAHSSVLAWRIPGAGAWWAVIYGVAQSRTRLQRLSSGSSRLCSVRL